MIYAFINVSCKYNLYKLLEKKKQITIISLKYYEIIKNKNINYYLKKSNYTI